MENSIGLKRVEMGCFRWFLATLVTGIIGLLLVVVVALVEFIAYYTDRDNRMILQPFICE